LTFRRARCPIGEPTLDLGSRSALRLSGNPAARSGGAIGDCDATTIASTMQSQVARYDGLGRVQSSPHSSHHNADAADSDDGGQQSGDDAENDLDDHDIVRGGKRKRPISVS
jgi:hypothetical protein